MDLWRSRWAPSAPFEPNHSPHFLGWHQRAQSKLWQSQGVLWPDIPNLGLGIYRALKTNRAQAENAPGDKWREASA